MKTQVMLVAPHSRHKPPLFSCDKRDVSVCRLFVCVPVKLMTQHSKTGAGKHKHRAIFQPFSSLILQQHPRLPRPQDNALGGAHAARQPAAARPHIDPPPPLLGVFYG